MKKYMDFMGKECKDKVTGFVGVVECVSFDLYGCVQVALRSKVGKADKKGESMWFDWKRLEVISKKPVMAVPDFNEPDNTYQPKTAGNERGPASKPNDRF